MIKFTCPSCGKKYSVAENLAGKAAGCSRCHRKILIPSAVTSAPTPAPATSPGPTPTPATAPTAPPIVSAPTPAPAPLPPPSPAKDGGPHKIVVSFSDRATERPPIMELLPETPPSAPATSPALTPTLAGDATMPSVVSAPTPAVASLGAPGASPAKKIPMRIRRLVADAEHMQKVFEGFPLIRLVGMAGNPPDKYRIEYRVRGIAKGENGQTFYRDEHLVEIQLTSEYPRQSPKCRILTPIFHPNFDPAVICVGDHWTAAERLADLVVRIGEMIAYQTYNIKSPLDGEAAMWADMNQPIFPIDSRSLTPPGL